MREKHSDKKLNTFLENGQYKRHVRYYKKRNVNHCPYQSKESYFQTTSLSFLFGDEYFWQKIFCTKQNFGWNKKGKKKIPKVFMSNKYGFNITKDVTDL